MTDDPSTEPRRNLAITPTWAADPTVAHWLGAIKDTRERTLEVVGQVDPGAVDWQRDDENTIGSLLYHIAVIEADWLYAEVLTEPFPEDVVALFSWDVRDGSGRLSDVRSRTIEEHLDLLGAIRDRLVAAFEPMTIDEFLRPRALPLYDVTPEWVLHHLMQHEAEHRGQIAMLASAFAASTGAGGAGS